MRYISSDVADFVKFMTNVVACHQWLVLYSFFFLCVAIPLPGFAATPVPLGLPEVPVPEANPQSPAKIALGKRLFEDTRLSADGTLSCASCHQAEHAFADRLPVAEGLGKKKGTRNTPSLLNVAYLTSLFWDGRRDTLEKQAGDPFVNQIEHGLKDHQALLKIIQQDADYLRAFNDVFRVEGANVDLGHVSMAIASFERTLISAGSAFDRSYYGKEPDAMSESAKRGLSLFRGKGRCISCHTFNEKYALFTDNEFHSIGVGLDSVKQNLADTTRRVVKSKPEATFVLLASDRDIAALGRFNVTRKPADIGRFRTPTLRNVALTPPYMHDGSVRTLEEAIAIEIYYRGNATNQPIILSKQDADDLLNFLIALTSPPWPRDTPLGPQ